MTALMAGMVFRAVQAWTVRTDPMARMVVMVRLVSAAMWGLRVLPARKARRVNGVSVDPLV